MKEQIRAGLEKIVEFGRAIKKNWKIGLTALGLSFIINSNIYAIKGRLDLINGIYYYGSQNVKIIHKTGALEGYGLYDDDLYFPMFNPSGIASKIVSILEEGTGKKEVEIDRRSEDSNSSVNLELSLHSQSGSPITISSRNELWCSLPIAGAPYFYDFGSQPITYWERDANDPNMFYLVANVRKEMSQNRGIIPLADLNGTYNSEEPYLHAQIRFNDHFVHLNDDNIVDLKDFSIFANAFGRTGITDTNRAEPNDLGAWADYDLDGDVDVNDLSIFTDYYLTGKKYHLENGWIIE